MTAVAERGRPAGEVRQKIFETIREHGAMPLCDLAARGQIGYDACKLAVNNAVRAERLQIVGHIKRAHAKQWVALYDVAEPMSPAQPAEVSVVPGVVLLDQALRAWYR